MLLPTLDLLQLQWMPATMLSGYMLPQRNDAGSACKVYCFMINNKLCLKKVFNCAVR